MRAWLAHGAVLLMACLAPAAALGADEVALARSLANAGRAPAAIAMLQARLEAHPADSDARVLLGIYLSWQGRDSYREARAALEVVLASSPDHGDALPALMNVELWDGHPERAEHLGRAASGPGAPLKPAIFLARARALAALNRVHDALPLVRRVLDADPGDQAAASLKQRLDERARAFELGTGMIVDWFDDGTAPWREHTLSLKRETSIGSVLGRASRAYRFGDHDDLFEAEAYPRLRSGTYAYLNVGVGRRRALYPKYRFGADLYQVLGPGFEASVGWRQLRFAEPVDVFVGSLGKYWGRWLFIARGYVTPGSGDASVSGHGLARWYFGGEGTSYLGLRYARGLARELRTTGDTSLLDSDTVALDAVAWLGRRWQIYGQGIISRGESVRGMQVLRYTGGGGLGWRF